MMYQKSISLCLILGIALSMVGAGASAARQSPEDLLEKLGTERGICVVLGDSRCELAFEIARRSNLLVYVQLPGSEDVDQARRKAEAAGLDAGRVQIDRGVSGRLHLADSIADGLIAVGDAA
ncbi:MAG: hypothetical protein JSW66_05605, partial [Phycisphaerales bacterium]